MYNFQEYNIVLNNDVQKCEIGDKICVTGIVIKKWKRSDGGFGIQIQDLTGFATIRFSANVVQYEKKQFIKGKRVRVYASVAVNSKSERYLHEIIDVEFLEEMNQWSREYDIIEQESLVLISKNGL